jgi:ankyrin repeat protein
MRASILLLFATSAFAADIGVIAPLVDAVKNGDRAAAFKLIDQKINVNTAESDGTTALHWAAHNNDTDLVDKLIQAGAQADVKNDFGATPMSEAATNSNTAIIEKLLKAGADPDSTGTDGMTALMIVARSTNVTAAKLLLDHGAHLNAKEQQRDQTALMWAAAQKQGPMVKELIARGAEIDARTQTNEFAIQVSAEPRAGYRPAGGLTAMLYATREGCIECVQALKESGANLNLADPEGITPLIMAIWNQHFDTAAYLIKSGANVNKWDWWGRGPLWCAVDLNTIPHGGRSDGPSLDETSPLQIIDMLLKAGANPNLQLKLLPPFRNVGNDRGLDTMITIGISPLVRAAKALDAPAVELLVKHGALLDLGNNTGITAIMAAAGMGSVDADTRGTYTTPDVQQRSIATLDVLLKAGADINSAGGRRRQTPLMAAAFWGWNDVVQYLVDHGAKLDARDSGGLTAIDAALGKAGGNSRGGQRVDVHEDTAALLKKLGVPASK